MRMYTYLFLLIGVAACSPKRSSLVTFDHLRHLTERILFEGDSVDVIRIYANAPAYDWVDAGEEGIACVDDASRAAVLYLRHAELTGDRTSLARGRSLLEFVLKMQSDDGTFVNFINTDYSKNLGGSTSFSSFGWWAGRAVWCLGLGSRLFQAVDSAFAGRLSGAIERTFPHLDTLLQSYGRERTESGMRVPEWLLYGSGADATSELVLGLTEYQRTKPQLRVRSYVEKLCDGMMIMQDGDIAKFPHGAHRSWETRWHAWGNGQTQALVMAGELLGNERMIASARREADGFYGRLLILGNQREWDFADTSNRREFEQIAYDVRPMAVGLVRLQEATGDPKYGVMAGLAASWLFGNNPAGEPMYDIVTGRGYDGILPDRIVNRNSGAESTIEALITVLEVERSPEARAVLFHRKGIMKTDETNIIRLFAGRDGADTGLRINLARDRLELLGRDEAAAWESNQP